MQTADLPLPPMPADGLPSTRVLHVREAGFDRRQLPSVFRGKGLDVTSVPASREAVAAVARLDAFDAVVVELGPHLARPVLLLDLIRTYLPGADVPLFALRHFPVDEATLARLQELRVEFPPLASSGDWSPTGLAVRIYEVLRRRPPPSAAARHEAEQAARFAARPAAAR